jgi:hypothetical protein
VMFPPNDSCGVRKCLLAGLALMVFYLAAAESVRADSKVYRDALHSTGLVEVPDPKGCVTYGTCWVVDRRRGLALTTQHVVEDAAEAVIYFPAYRDGAAIPELAHYHHQVAAVRGRVVHCDVLRDLALLRLDALPEDVVAIPLSAHGAGPGDAVHSVGNSGAATGTLWRYTAGKVRSVYQARILQENGLLKARIVETELPINPGDSGGPLVNDSGELVGVVLSSERQTRLVSFNVDVSEVRAFLGEACGTKAQSVVRAAGTDPQHPPVQGSWKVALIDQEGEQRAGECRFEADGTFTLTARAIAGTRTRRGRYSYANGVLLLAWDRFKVRKGLHWVNDCRFTFLADEMLIFDRQPDAGSSEETPNAQALTSDVQPLTSDAVKPSIEWVIASMLIGSACAFLLLGIKIGAHRDPMKIIRAGTRKVEKDVPRAVSQDRCQTME